MAAPIVELRRVCQCRSSPAMAASRSPGSPVALGLAALSGAGLRPAPRGRALRRATPHAGSKEGAATEDKPGQRSSDPSFDPSSPREGGGSPRRQWRPWSAQGQAAERAEAGTAAKARPLPYAYCLTLTGTHPYLPTAYCLTFCQLTACNLILTAN